VAFGGRKIENSERIQKKGIEKESSEGKRRADARDKTLISDTLIPDYYILFILLKPYLSTFFYLILV
jgi:hypothetical protein